MEIKQVGKNGNKYKLLFNSFREVGGDVKFMKYEREIIRDEISNEKFIGRVEK